MITSDLYNKINKFAYLAKNARKVSEPEDIENTFNKVFLSKRNEFVKMTFKAIKSAIKPALHDKEGYAGKNEKHYLIYEDLFRIWGEKSLFNKIYDKLGKLDIDSYIVFPELIVNLKENILSVNLHFEFINNKTQVARSRKKIEVSSFDFNDDISDSDLINVAEKVVDEVMQNMQFEKGSKVDPFIESSSPYRMASLKRRK